MIMGFAHIAINVSNLIAAENAWQSEGYHRAAIFLNVPNHPSKQKFLSHYLPHHDLMLLTHPSLWPLELTCHGPSNLVNNQLDWKRDNLEITLADPDPFADLLIAGLGFRQTEADVLELDNRISGWHCRLALRTGISTPVNLNAIGPTCLAFYCNRIEEDTERLIELGATDFTGIFDICLGERNMSINMLRSPGGLLLELINPRKPK